METFFKSTTGSGLRLYYYLPERCRLLCGSETNTYFSLYIIKVILNILIII